MSTPKLYMMLLGCRPKGRHTEQHDLFFTVGATLADMVPDIDAFWPEAKGNLHLDAWREVTQVDGYDVQVVPKGQQVSSAEALSLFFINLGGYKQDEFEEYHYKLLIVAASVDEAKEKAKATVFYKHCGIKGAPSHIDDKYGIDIDEMHKIEEILPETVRAKYKIVLTKTDTIRTDEYHLGYLPTFRIK